MCTENDIQLPHSLYLLVLRIYNKSEFLQAGGTASAARLGQAQKGKEGVPILSVTVSLLLWKLEMFKMTK